jgi:hypothetical protein
MPHEARRGGGQVLADQDRGWDRDADCCGDWGVVGVIRGIEMETIIKMDRSSMIVLPTMIRKRFKASRFELKRGVSLVLLALAMSTSGLYIASAALPDNNNTDAGNYSVAYLSNNPIVDGMDGIIDIYDIIKVVVTAAFTYIVSLRLLKRRLERENAVRFLTEHYLPLLGTLERTVYAWYVWSINDNYREEVGVSDEETKQIFLEDLLKLSQTLESIMKGGAIILLYKIDEEIYNNVMALDYLIKDCLYKISQDISDDDITEAINKITPSIEKLHKELSKMGMPKLIEEYQKIMKDKNPILED